MGSINMDEYPYLIVRLFAAFYVRRRFRETNSREVDSTFSDPYVELPKRAPSELPGGPGDRARIVRTALQYSKRTKLRCCVVFAADDAVYVEPDGTASESQEPPSGGLSIKDV
jgi:hypothetical protein